jgi:signal transduction histidine kinase/ligand-binding sensor domain-containing protein
MANLPRRQYFHACFLVLFLAQIESAAAASSGLYGRDPFYMIETWESDDGLPENSATAMAQDADGYLWFGTFGGLVRFDGVKFGVFDPSNTPELPSAGIVNLHIDATGRLWVSTLDGIAALSRGRWRRYVGHDGWAGNYARTIVERRNGDLLFATFDGHLLEFRGERFHELPAPPAKPGIGFVGAADELGQWWALQGGEFVARLRGTSWEQPLGVTSVPAENVGATAARDGGLWILLGDELIKYRGAKETSRVRLRHQPNEIWSMFEDSRGNVWIAGQGLCRVAPDGDVKRWTTANGLSSDSVRFVFEDREQNLWVGTNGGGLQRFRPRRFQSVGPEHGLRERVVTSVWPDGTGGTLAATYGKGLFRITDAGVESVPLPNPNPQYLQSVITDRTGNVWVGTYGHGLFIVATSGTRRVPGEQTGGDNIVALFEDSRGCVWVSGGQFAAVFSGETSRVFTEQDGLPRGDVCCFAEDSKGSIWLTNRRGVYRIDDSGRVVEMFDQQGKPISNVTCLKADADASMWLGSTRGLLHVRQEKIVNVDEIAKLESGGVTGILEDDDGLFWMRSARGILRVRKGDLIATERDSAKSVEVQVFDQSDGLPSKEAVAARQPSCARDSSGTLWFATARGVAWLRPHDVTFNQQPARVRIESLTFETPKSKSRREAKLADVAQASLPAGSRRVEIHFTALSLGAPHKVRFHVKLDGQDSEWQNAGAERMVHYHDLPPRKYVFRARATNDDGVWNAEEASITFAVEPFFWQTSWFVGAIVLALFGCGAFVTWSVLRARHDRVRERLVLREQRNELVHLSRVSMLGEISGSLAHELGQPLTAILCNAEAAQRFLARDAMDRDELGEILDAIVEDDRRACEVIDRLRPLLKRGEVRPESLDLNSAVRDVLKIVERELEHQGIAVRTVLQRDLPPARVNRVQLQQVLINLIFNGRDAMLATANGPGRALVVTTDRTSDGTLRVSVADQGGGIPADQLERIFEPFFTTKRDGMGLGLSLCRTIVDAHGGRLWATNNPTAGASFHFTLPPDPQQA